MDFELASKKEVEDLFRNEENYTFLTKAIFTNNHGERITLGFLGEPLPGNLHLQDTKFILECLIKELGSPNNHRTSFSYIFKGNEFKELFYEVKEIKGKISCSIILPRGENWDDYRTFTADLCLKVNAESETLLAQIALLTSNQILVPVTPESAVAEVKQESKIEEEEKPTIRRPRRISK